jgi:hypothetical protein
MCYMRVRMRMRWESRSSKRKHPLSLGKAIEVMHEVQDPTRLHGWRVQVCVIFMGLPSARNGSI